MGERARVRVAGLALVMVCAVCCGGAWCQSGVGNGGQKDGVTTVHGRVLNEATKAPVGRALVRMGNQYAMLTDDRGQFEFKVPTPKTGGSVPGGRSFTSTRVDVRKQGFMSKGKMVTIEGTGDWESNVTIYVVPEALLVGHVEVPGSEGDVRIECELYKREMREGQEAWSPSGTFTTWANGEFRFSELREGTYKLITHEQMDRESLVAEPGTALFGYPPIYYPNTTDFSAASPIVVKAGETAQVNLTVARKEYYPVQLRVRNAAMGRRVDVMVYPMGHHSPGWSLGYNPSDESIEGMLPDGNYTVEANAYGEMQSTGILNFSVRGETLQGPALNLIPNTSVVVNVREDFSSEQNGTSGGEGNVELVRGQRQGSGVQVSLNSMEELYTTRGRQGLMAQESEGHELTIPNVPPGRYRVNVYSGKGYAASIQSGGNDLLHQPLVVGWGGRTPPIEITLRNDGGQVSGTVEEAASGEQNSTVDAFRYVYLLPLGGPGGQPPPTTQSMNGKFNLGQVPPGDYLVVACEGAQQDLPYGSEEALRSLEGKGQTIHVEAGQSVNVKVKVMAGGEAE